MFLQGARRKYTRSGSQQSEGPFLWIVLPTYFPTMPCGRCSTTAHVSHDGKYWCERCRANFISSVQPGLKHCRAYVRRVRLTQCGHFMMGTISIHGREFTVSGTYGGDGLPDTTYPNVWEKGIPIPQSIASLWEGLEGFDCGWNGPGKEGPLLREWGLANITTLRRAGRDL